MSKAGRVISPMTRTASPGPGNGCRRKNSSGTASLRPSSRTSSLNSWRKPAPSFAASTSDQVREILEAAERSVASVRAEASREASDHVTQVQQATAGMLSKLDELESELHRLLTALRASGERLTAGLEQLQADVAGTPAEPSRRAEGAGRPTPQG